MSEAQKAAVTRPTYASFLKRHGGERMIVRSIQDNPDSQKNQCTVTFQQLATAPKGSAPSKTSRFVSRAQGFGDGDTTLNLPWSFDKDHVRQLFNLPDDFELDEIDFTDPDCELPLTDAHFMFELPEDTAPEDCPHIGVNETFTGERLNEKGEVVGEIEPMITRDGDPITSEGKPVYRHTFLYVGNDVNEKGRTWLVKDNPDTDNSTAATTVADIGATVTGG